MIAKDKSVKSVWYVVCLDSSGRVFVAESPCFVQSWRGGEVKYCTQDAGAMMRMASTLETSRGKIAPAKVAYPSVNASGISTSFVRNPLRSRFPFAVASETV